MRLRSAVVVVWLAALAALAASVGGYGGNGTRVRRRHRRPRSTTWRAWLCRPGQKIDWCNADLEVTLVYANGSRETASEALPTKRPIDCFYVYPTVSAERRGNSDLKIGTAEKQVVLIEASRFEQVCRVFAPAYRQTTVYSSEYGGDGEKAYRDVRAAWRDYLARYNHGRGVVLIGHSQGAFHLTDLIRKEIEGSASVRKLLVSAILLGGNVTVAKGSDTGGSFTALPACRAKTQSGCVVAYSTWGRTPPEDAAFQRVEGPSQQVLCVNPAAPGGGSAPITPVFPWFAPEGIITKPLAPQVETLWIAFPGLYTARCVKHGSRAWLLVEHAAMPNDRRQLVQEVLSPNWGLHAADANIALHELVDLVRAQGTAWAAHH